MFDNKAKIKKIVVAIVGIILVVSVLSGIKITSSRNSSGSNNASAVETTESKNKSKSDSNKISSEDKKDLSDSGESEGDILNNQSEEKSAESGLAYGENDDIQSMGQSSNGDTADEDSDKGNLDNESSDTGDAADTVPNNTIITCTIEIRCDNASASKSQINNPGILQYIPDDGTILAKTTYSAVQGYTVFDVLNNVTRDNGIAITADSGGTYVTSINHLSQQMIGPGSGWAYRVNNILVNISAAYCKVKENDTIIWYYVRKPGDSL